MTSSILQALPQTSWQKRVRVPLILLAFVLVFPFLVGFIDGQSPAAVLAGEAGNSKFLQGLAIEIFVLAMYAISYDLVFGINGMLSFGHAMFFAVGAYGSGIMLKSFEWGLGPTLIGVLVLAVLQALLFGMVLPRVSGIPFALVTLGLASVFYIVVQSSDLVEWTGADIGLQGVPVPEWIDTNIHRFRLYLIAFVLLAIVFFVYKKLVASPVGSVMVASRENEERALMLGYRTFWFKIFGLLVASTTAALAGILFTIHQPIVTPHVASLGWTVTALLMILIGGIGTLSGAIVGAFAVRLLQFYLDRWFGGIANFLLGSAYVLIVLFLPYGIVGTWRLKAIERKHGWERLKGMIGVGGSE